MRGKGIEYHGCDKGLTGENLYNGGCCVEVLAAIVVSFESSADISISLLLSFRDLIRLALLAGTRTLCFSSLNRDLQKREW